MAAELMHLVEIQAEPDTVYDALSTGQGLAGFWTSDSRAVPEIGSTAEFGFGGPSLKVRVEDLRPGQRVEWTALGDFPDWRGTSIAWDIRKNPAGATEVLFSHGGWAAELPQQRLASVNYTWGQVVGRLKAYTETGQPDPLFDPPAAKAGR